MRDGYYLSTYLHCNKLTNLMHISVRHDQNLSLWEKKGEEVRLVHYWELERLTRYKMHGISFYDKEHLCNFINSLLKEYNLSMDDMCEIWGTPEIDRGEEYAYINDYPGIAYHSIAHLFSGLLLDTDKFYNDNIIGLSVDGGPDSVVDENAWDKAFYSGCVVDKGNIEVFPIDSPGNIWIMISEYYKLREGTLMALASASKSEFTEEVIMDTNKMKSLEEITDYIMNLVKKADELDESDVGVKLNYWDPRFSIEENKISMVMKEVQKVSFQIMISNVESILETYKVNPEEYYISISGGYALNCPTNSYLMNKYKFKGFIAPPCVNDGGLSLGIALHTFYKRMKSFKFKLKHAYYGDVCNDVEKVLNNDRYKPFIRGIDPINLDKIVEDIEKEPVVWVNGKSEIGPRALGNRSILSDSRFESSKSKLNEIKQRQWWRPVAPIVLNEKKDEWFEEAYSSKFMLHTFRIKEDKKEKLKAVSHLDNSARIQTVTEEDNELVYKILKHFYEKTGVPILCNTSLNDRGEPIINIAKQAIEFALKKKLSVAYINGMRIELQNQEKFIAGQIDTEKNLMNVLGDEEKARELELLNPYGIHKNILEYYFDRPKIQKQFDIRTKVGARQTVLYINAIFNSTVGLKQMYESTDSVRNDK